MQSVTLQQEMGDMAEPRFSRWRKDRTEHQTHRQRECFGCHTFRLVAMLRKTSFMEKKGTEVKGEAFLNKTGNLKGLRRDQDRNLLKRASTFNLQSVLPWFGQKWPLPLFQERPCGQRRNCRILDSTGQAAEAAASWR